VSAKYLLPCHCGLHIVIEPRQAGETVVCSCGVSLQVPTMLGMSALEPVIEESTAPPAEADWGWPHATLLIGLVMVAAAFVLVVLVYWNRPISRFDVITPEQIRETARQLPPVRTWDAWEMMKQGLDQRTDQPYADAMTRFRIWRVATAVLALAGVGLVVAGLAMGGRLALPSHEEYEEEEEL